MDNAKGMAAFQLFPRYLQHNAAQNFQELALRPCPQDELGTESP